MSNIPGLLVEDERPKTISDCILPSALKAQFQTFIESGEIPSLLLSGRPGTGKTTVARALCNDLGCDYILINGSEESGIDTLRTKVKNFAATVSLISDSSHKVIILDEADYLNANSVQPALRGLIEEFWSNCRFIFTCNFKNRIIAPLHSRCSTIEFDFGKDAGPQLMADFYTRCLNILDKHNVKYDSKVLAEFIKLQFPDFRKTLNELQRYAANGAIDSGILSSMDNQKYKELIGYLKTKNFKEIRTWVGSNPSLDPSTLWQKLYDNAYNYLEPQSIPQAILIISDYDYKGSFCSNPEINIVAALVELMVECQFKN